MAHSVPSAADSFVSVSKSEQPWLLPENRRVRNLTAICLRNLTLDPGLNRRERRKTIDDDAVPNTLKSPSKIVALREQRSLAQSRSSTDLRTVAELDLSESLSDRNGEERSRETARHEHGHITATPRTPLRPSHRLRRRSTLEWNNATPQMRQERLERVTMDRMADVFFSLHIHGIDEPIYVSETIQQTINPTFRDIDLSLCGPGITRLATIVIRFWVKSVESSRWANLLSSELDLRVLQYLGKSLDIYDRPLPRNAVIISLTDGVYAVPTTFNAHFLSHEQFSTARGSSGRPLPTSSFDALLRLAKLDDSIQDAIATRDELAADLENIIEINRATYAERDEVAETEDRLKTVDYAKATVKKQLEKARLQRVEKQKSLELRRAHMSDDTAIRVRAVKMMREAILEFPSLQTEHEIKEQAIRNQRRRICEELQACYQIESIPKQSLSFTIRGIHLPNSDVLDSEPPEQVAAAWGHVSYMVLLLSFYLEQPLPYPVNPKGSHSTVYDPISLLKTNVSSNRTYREETSLRTYPLFSQSVPRFRFDYGVFLLNKNIQVLLESVYNVRVLDIRHTLPNLKYLLYVATAGEGELPARKAGGVRGLLRPRLPNELRPSGSRNNSQDSMGSGLSAFFKGTAHPANGKAKGDAMESLRRSAEMMNGSFKSA